MNRREFMAVAAALPGFPIPSSDIATDGSSDEAGKDDAEDEIEYGRTTVVNTSGGLEVFADGNHETKVRVSSHPEGIGLTLSNGMGQMNVLLLPEDINPLCEELLEAKAKAQPGEVEYSREWITEDFRDGDADD